MNTSFTTTDHAPRVLVRFPKATGAGSSTKEARFIPAPNHATAKIVHKVLAVISSRHDLSEEDR